VALYGGGDADGWLLVNSQPRLDLEAARERRKVAGEEKDTTRRGSGGTARTSIRGNLGRSAVKEKV
jgi:hypothetical protein